MKYARYAAFSAYRIPTIPVLKWIIPSPCDTGNLASHTAALLSVDGRWKNTGNGEVRLCYYTMEIGPFKYHFGNVMTALRSYIHSIITHITVDWMGPVSHGLEMECSSLHWRVILVYFRTSKYDFCIGFCGSCLKSVLYLQYKYIHFTTTAAYRKRTNQARPMPLTNIQSRHFTLNKTLHWIGSFVLLYYGYEAVLTWIW